MKTLNNTSLKNCSQNSSSDSDQLVWPIQTTRICKQFENNIRIIRQHNLKTTGNNPKRWICVDFSKIVSIIASENPLRDGLSWIENSKTLIEFNCTKYIIQIPDHLLVVALLIKIKKAASRWIKLNWIVYNSFLLDWKIN